MNRATKAPRFRYVSIIPERSTRMYQVDPSRLIAPGNTRELIFHAPAASCTIGYQWSSSCPEELWQNSGLENKPYLGLKMGYTSSKWLHCYTIYSDRKHDDKPLDFRVSPCFPIIFRQTIEALCPSPTHADAAHARQGDLWIHRIHQHCK